VGAINVCALAAWADTPRSRGERLERAWTSLSITDVIQPAPREMWHMLRALVGKPIQIGADERRGGLVNPVGLERVIRRTIRFQNIREHLRRGLLRAVSVSATHVASGGTVVFVSEGSDEPLPGWGSDTTVHGRKVELRAEHALASAAIPLIFPAVRVDGHFYCDGGLRQNVPLAPARRLGAERLVVVTPRHLDPQAPTVADATLEAENEASFPSPLFLLGKTLNALLLDRIDADLDRLRRINHIARAGKQVFGADFLPRLNAQLTASGHGAIRPLETTLVRSSVDIGALAADFVRSPAFARRTKGLMGKVLQRLAEGEARDEADLLSYVMFDGEFARQLIEVGHKDAAARHEALCAIFAAEA
jgi:NTE family protein